MKSRRGLSTVVGAVFFIIAATTVITYISYSMNSIDEFAQSVIVSETENINRGMEEISISQATIDGGEFNATVINTGSLPVKLTRLWIVNEDTGANSKADLDIMINPGNQDHIDSTGISVDSATSYTLKAVTSRGNIATFAVSPNTSTQIQIIVPAEVQPEQEFTVVSIITNNSTQPNNIANLVPLITNNASVTQLENVLPASVAVLPQGNSVTFTSKWIAPTQVGTLWFNASYTGAPVGSWNIANMTVAISTEAEEATNSKWSQAASRVGILISGIPNPVEAANSGGLGKWGIGIINPIDRDVDIYAVGISSPSDPDFLATPLVGWEPVAPLDWRLKTSGDNMALWEGGETPITIPAESVGQFRLTTGFSASSNPEEVLIIIQALSSEGKLQTSYSISALNDFQTINMYYTDTPSNPAANWSYLIEDLPSGKTNQIFNATIENSSSDLLDSKIKLIILVPADFTNVGDVSDGSGGWEEAEIFENADGSHVISVETTASKFPATVDDDFYLVYQFNATNPTVTDTKLYVFQTTSIYPTSGWGGGDAVQVASALSEAGVQVIPPP